MTDRPPVSGEPSHKRDIEWCLDCDARLFIHSAGGSHGHCRVCGVEDDEPCRPPVSGEPRSRRGFNGPTHEHAFTLQQGATCRCGADRPPVSGEPNTEAGRAFEVRFNDPTTRPRHLHDVRPYIRAIEAEASTRAALDVELVEATLQELWRVRDSQGHFIYDIPVPPDEQTARAFTSVYARLAEQEGEGR